MVVGRIRAGKDTVAKMLAACLEGKRWKRKRVVRVNFSDSLGAVLNIFDVPRERRYYNEFSIALQATSFGRRILQRVVIKKIRELTATTDFLILGGGRFREDLDVLKGIGCESVIVGVTASLRNRYRRAKLSDKDGASTLREFHDTDCAVTEGDIEFLLSCAEVVVQNDRTQNELWEKVEEFAQTITKK